MSLSYRIAFGLAFVISASSGVAGFAIRSAANRPHPIYIGIGIFAIVFGIVSALISVAKASA